METIFTGQMCLISGWNFERRYVPDSELFSTDLFKQEAMTSFELFEGCIFFLLQVMRVNTFMKHKDLK